jgi:hypothetical protein
VYRIRTETIVKAYLDNVILGGLAQGDLDPGQMAATFKLIELGHDGQLSLVTSSVAKEEIARVPSAHRPPHDAVYAVLMKIPTVDEQVLVPRPIVAGPRVGAQIFGPMVVRDPGFAFLCDVLLPGRSQDDVDT